MSRLLKTSLIPGRTPMAVAVGCCLLLSFVGSPIFSAEWSLNGRLVLEEKNKDRTKIESRFSVLYFVPDADVDVEPIEDAQTITMARKQFQPRILTVTQGTTVEFPNDDTILHNVFSLSGKNRFDLGLYRRGDSKKTTLDHPGIVQIFCNVHHSMVAYILVLDTPFFATPGRDGRFNLPGLPGKGKLVAWHERAEPLTLEITPTTDLVTVRLDITKPRVPPHRNKFGKPYARKRRGRAY